MPCVQSSFPKVFAEIEEQGTPSGDVNWLSILKEKTLRARAFRQLIIEMADIKSRGNTSYVQREYSAAKVIYRQAIELMSDPSNNIDQVVMIVVRQPLHTALVSCLLLLLLLLPLLPVLSFLRETFSCSSSNIVNLFSSVRRCREPVGFYLLQPPGGCSVCKRRSS